MFKKNKLAKKVYLIIFLIIIVVFGGTYFLNNFFLSKYYVYETRSNLNLIYENSQKETLTQFLKSEKEIEEKNNVTIITLSNEYLNNLGNLNEEISLKLNKNKINISKLWLTNNDLNELNEQGYVNKIFYQNKLQSNYFIKMFKKDNEIIILGKSMANDIETINIINKFNLYIISFAIILSLVLVLIFTRKIVKSLEKLKLQTENIGNLNFKAEEIKTGDEIEELSKKINEMSDRLENAHLELEKRNEDLKRLLGSISHEVKTPLALIKAYAIGIEDGLDDGTFTNIIINEVDDASKLIENILELSRVQRKESEKSYIDLKKRIEEILLKFSLKLEEKNIKIIKEFQKNTLIYEDSEGIDIVLNNFISNAIKYNSGNYIKICYEKDILYIENKQDGIDEEKIKDIWKPFYVGEESRSKELSGTGLGLSIVEEILKREKIEFGVSLKNDVIKFYIKVKSEKM
ncbi:MAG: sensor histidine kinase [Clostridium sp.]|uniref:sensor histidine kinase n=1 Tax=Clostridium sp. TaxID=1506 RepID=UPI003EE4D311